MPYKNLETRRQRQKEKLTDPEYHERYHGWQKDSRKRKTEWFRSLKENKPCHVCNTVYHPVCMDYHHLDRKTKDFDLSRLSYSKKKVLAEIAKCVLVCALCHRLIESGIIPLDEKTETT